MKIQTKIKKIKKIKAALLLGMLATTTAKAQAENIDKVELQIGEYGNAQFTSRINDVIDNLDEGVKKDLIEKKCEIYLLEGINDAESVWNAQKWGPLSSSILGMTIDPHFDGINNVESKIYVEACIHPGYYENYPTASQGLTEEEFNYRIAVSTTIHEIGHIIDYVGNNKLSDTNEFYQVYINDKDNFKQTEEFIVNNRGIIANIDGPKEYFAESFAAFYLTPEDLQKYCELTYDYMSNMTNNLNNKYGYKSNNKKLK